MKVTITLSLVNFSLTIDIKFSTVYFSIGEKMKTVYLISGKLQSGKNLFASYLKELFEKDGQRVKTESFAQPVKDECKETFKPLVEYLQNNHGLEYNDDNWYENKTPLTRMLLQIYGTDIFRNRVNKNWWVDKLARRIQQSEADVFLITDVRFPNEINQMKWHSGTFELIPIRINRNIERSDAVQHESETALDSYKNFRFTFDNNGSLEEVRNFAKQIAKYTG